MYPIGTMIVNKVNYGGNCPGYGVRPIYVRDIVNDAHNDRYVNNPKDTPYAKHNNHRHDASSGASANGSYAMRVG